MISPSKLAALRLALQPLTCFNVTSTSGPTPTPAPYTPALRSACRVQQQQQQQSQSQSQEVLQIQPPKRIRLSPVPDSALCSPTPTRAAFLLTPTRFAMPYTPSSTGSESMSPHFPSDPRSPMLSTCVSEGCDNWVSSERNICIKCRDVFVSLLAQQQAKRTQTYMSSPVQVSPKRPSAGPSFSATATYGDRQFGESMKSNGLAPIGEERYSGRSPTIKPLSVTHPRPLSIDINRCSALSPKLARKPERELEDYGSPDALYFGKRNRRMLGQAYRRPSAAVEPSFPNLKTSSPMMKVRDNDFAA